MKRLISEHLRERYYDARDWADIRPDPHWWPVALTLGIGGVGFMTLPPMIFAMAVVGALVAALAGLILLAVWVTLWVLSKACLGAIAQAHRLRVNGPKATHSPVRGAKPVRI